MSHRTSVSAGLVGAAKSRRETIVFWLVVAFVFLSRLPFIASGYGNDPDAWQVALSARRIAFSGQYEASRLPGYPVQELAWSLLWRGGPAMINGCTALLSALAVACFMSSLKRLRSADPLLAGAALALTPVVFINSTNGMDYMWALAFILASHHCALLGRPLLAGGLLGVAVGCRLTSGGMVLPLGILLLGTAAGPNRLRSALAFCAATGLVAAVAYAPVVGRYGWAFLRFAEPSDYPPALMVFSRATVRTWGCVGGAAVIGGLLLSLIRRHGGAAASVPAPVGSPPMVAAVVTVGIYSLAFLRLPLEEGYLIPAVPFMIVLLGKVLPRRSFRVACLALCVSPFLFNVGRAARASPMTYSRHALRFSVGGREILVDPLRGPLLRDHAERAHGMAFVDRVLARTRTLDKCVLVVGYWRPQILVQAGSPPLGRGQYVSTIDAEQFSRYRSEGLEIYFLPEMARYNKRARGLDLLRAGATPLDLHWRR